MSNVILFGFRGVGKSYFGRKLAEKTGRPFLDTDDLLVRLHNGPEKTPRAIYQLLGEEDFRALERLAVLSLQNTKNAIIALGGGTVLDPKNVLVLQTLGSFIYLDAPFEYLEPRVGQLQNLYEERKPIYASIAAKKVSVDQSEPKILEELLNGL